jgi:hypothetical protein
MSTITDESTIFTLVHNEAYSGLNAGSQGTQDFSNIYISSPVAHVASINATVNLTTGFHTYFKLEGYNPVTQKIETWHCRDVPILLPPSGDPLLNVAIIGTWIDR